MEADPPRKNMLDRLWWKIQAYSRIIPIWLLDIEDNLESGVTAPKSSLVEITMKSKGIQQNKILSLP